MEFLRTLLGLDEFICGKSLTQPTSGGISNLLFKFGIPTPLVKLGKIQHKATKIAHRMIGFNFNKRLKTFNITTLATRRTRSDLIKNEDISKIDDINWKVKPVVLPHRVGHRSYF